LKRILITGARGFVGAPLSAKLSSLGYEVIPFRHTDTPSPLLFEGLEGVVHLAGEPVAPSAWAIRWSKEKKRRILVSRVEGTTPLVQALLKTKNPPQFFFSASAVAYYGSCGDRVLTEESRKGRGFLSDVCEKWEKTSAVLKERGIRVIHGRFGNVVDPSGGIFKRVATLFKWGPAVQFGDGKQWMSWIALSDLVDAISSIVFETTLEGAVNCTSPHPVTHREWTEMVAHFVSRRAIWKLPAPLVRLLCGEMGEELFLSSVRALPKKLIDSGFQFKKPQLENIY